uniref:Peptidase S1 domain-containing protein n=1 Tax=Heliothis virescens TaxID=7102 RepID=A0A2A4JVZ0_HELVI
MNKRVVVHKQASPNWSNPALPAAFMKMFISISLLLLLFLPQYGTESTASTTAMAVEGNQYSYIVRIEGILDASPKSSTNAIHICSAVVLSPTWTITAAHCVAFIYNMNAEQPASGQRSPVIRLGHTPPPADGKPPNDVVNIQEGYKHPGYRDFSAGGTRDLRNDVGMLRTDPIAIKDYAKISSADFTSMIGVTAKALGYRPPSSGTNGTAAQLQSSDVLIVECSSRSEMYPSLCAASQCGSGRGAACAGDAGGALLAAPGVVAITSRHAAHLCRAAVVPDPSAVGIFVPLSPYITWIANFILYVH